MKSGGGTRSYNFFSRGARLTYEGPSQTRRKILSDSIEFEPHPRNDPCAADFPVKSRGAAGISSTRRVPTRRHCVDELF